jgi:hypothetical protein
MARIHEFYNDRVIQYPPRSPDLTILDFFIFPYLKNTIFKNNPHNLEELQEAISNACNAITVLMLENAFEYMQRRVNSCIEAGGEHFEHFSVILNTTTLSFIAFISFKLKRLHMRAITKLTITSHLFNQSIGILGNRIKKI